MNQGVRREWRSAGWVPYPFCFFAARESTRPGNVYPLVPCLSLNINVSPRTGWGGLCRSGCKLTLDSRSAPRSWYSRAATGLCSRLNILEEDDDKYATNLHPGSLSPAYTPVHYQLGSGQVFVSTIEISGRLIGAEKIGEHSGV